LYEDNKELPAEGMMFTGDKGKIMAGFHVDKPQLIPEKRMKAMPTSEVVKKDKISGFQQFIDAIKAGKQCPGSFTEAWSLTEAVNLYAVALRSGRILKYDASKRNITNVREVNKYLTRDYRKGWNPETI
jgi:hypothetical protein